MPLNVSSPNGSPGIRAWTRASCSVSSGFFPQVRTKVTGARDLGQGRGTGIPCSPYPPVRRHFKGEAFHGFLSIDYLGRIHDRIHQLFVPGAPADVAVFLEPQYALYLEIVDIYG